ncbi:MAG: hypothetical protein RL660_1317 [Bacteroidota bacterium]
MAKLLLNCQATTLALPTRQKMNKALAKIAFLCLGAYILYQVVNRFIVHKNMKHYANFGITIPAGYEVHGIDVSKYQKDINWPLVAKMRDKGKRIEFAIIKCTEGVNLIDRFHKDNYSDAKEAGLVVGQYLYFRATHNGEAQARYFMKHSRLKSGDLAPVIDIEEMDNTDTATMLKNLRSCIETLRQHYKCDPIIYSNAKFYDTYLANVCKDLPLWVAHYYVHEPSVGRTYQLWQHNDAGTVDGIDAPVDFNVVNGSITDLLQLTIR